MKKRSPNSVHSTSARVVLALLLGAASVWACSIPVFRYALEKWPGDAYQAIVLHRGPLTAEQQSHVQALRDQSESSRAPVSIKTIDLNQDTQTEIYHGGVLPQLLLKYPLATHLTGTVWSGALDTTSVTRLFESPARQEIIDRLAGGESAVWVLLESGDASRDNTVAELLETRLAYLTTSLQLPKLDAQDIVNGLITIPEEDLRLDFSTMRLSRTNATESLFIQMLMGIERDLKDVREPIVFPVFGRGRALYALVGSGIKKETIDQAATFLIGKCSCQVKEQNPGVDLLLAADWDKLLKVHATAPPDLPTLAEIAKASPVTVTINPTSTPPTASQAPVTVTIPLTTQVVTKSYFTTGLPLLAGVGLLIAALFLWRRN